MVDDSYYLTPHEAALALVATSMKKARLKLDTLFVNSIIGGILFSAGGMLHVVVQANPELLQDNKGIQQLLQGLVYPIGLFYVVIMGAELFNSNVLFFTVGLLRGAVGILDLLINWFASWLLNLGSNLFVCYVICYLSGVFTTELIKQATIEIAVEKAKSSFIQTFIKGIACNFFVCLAIYLQIMCKPLHVKFLMMVLPVFTFVSLGYSHTVADMFLCPMGIMNGAPVSTATYIWKILIAETLGNIVGGLFFAIVVPYYMHLLVVERDSAQLGLPKYDARDEQPEINVDSRVVRSKDNVALQRGSELEILGNNDVPSKHLQGDDKDAEDSEKNHLMSSTSSSDSLASNSDNVVQRYDSLQAAPRASTARSLRSSLRSRRSNSNRETMRSPGGVFPVQGMGEPLEREKTIASGYYHRADQGNDDDDTATATGANAAPEVNAKGNDLYETRSILSRITTRSRKNADLAREEEEYRRAGAVDAREEYLANKMLRKLDSRKSVNAVAAGSENNADDFNNEQPDPLSQLYATRSANSWKSRQSVSNRLPVDLEKGLSHLNNNHTHLPHIYHHRTNTNPNTITSKSKSNTSTNIDNDDEGRFAHELLDQGMTSKAYDAANDVVGLDMDMRDVINWSHHANRKQHQERQQHQKQEKEQKHKLQEPPLHAQFTSNNTNDDDNNKKMKDVQTDAGGALSSKAASSVSEVADSELKKPDEVHQRA